MSKPRYDWWPYVKGMIRRYPELAREYEDLHSQAITQAYTGMPGGREDGRAMESVAIRELPGTRQREYEAVRRAIAATERYPNGRSRLKVVKLVLWDRSHTLEGAALVVPCHYKTAQGWHNEFIKLVASNFGLMDE